MPIWRDRNRIQFIIIILFTLKNKNIIINVLFYNYILFQSVVLDANLVWIKGSIMTIASGSFTYRQPQRHPAVKKALSLPNLQSCITIFTQDAIKTSSKTLIHDIDFEYFTLLHAQLANVKNSIMKNDWKSIGKPPIEFTQSAAKITTQMNKWVQNQLQETNFSDDINEVNLMEERNHLLAELHKFKSIIDTSIKYPDGEIDIDTVNTILKLILKQVPQSESNERITTHLCSYLCLYNSVEKIDTALISLVKKKEPNLLTEDIGSSIKAVYAKTCIELHDLNEYKKYFEALCAYEDKYLVLELVKQSAAETPKHGAFLLQLIKSAPNEELRIQLNHAFLYGLATHPKIVEQYYKRIMQERLSDDERDLKIFDLIKILASHPETSQHYDTILTSADTTTKNTTYMGFIMKMSNTIKNPQTKESAKSTLLEILMSQESAFKRLPIIVDNINNESIEKNKARHLFQKLAFQPTVFIHLESLLKAISTINKDATKALITKGLILDLSAQPRRMQCQEEMLRAQLESFHQTIKPSRYFPILLAAQHRDIDSAEDFIQISDSIGEIMNCDADYKAQAQRNLITNIGAKKNAMQHFQPLLNFIQTTAPKQGKDETICYFMQTFASQPKAVEYFANLNINNTVADKGAQRQILQLLCKKTKASKLRASIIPLSQFETEYNRLQQSYPLTPQDLQEFIHRLIGLLNQCRCSEHVATFVENIFYKKVFSSAFYDEIIQQITDSTLSKEIKNIILLTVVTRLAKDEVYLFDYKEDIMEKINALDEIGQIIALSILEQTLEKIRFKNHRKQDVQSATLSILTEHTRPLISQSVP